jgi:hypothetical protein
LTTGFWGMYVILNYSSLWWWREEGGGRGARERWSPSRRANSAAVSPNENGWAEHKQATKPNHHSLLSAAIFVFRARICRRLRGPGIDSDMPWHGGPVGQIGLSCQPARLGIDSWAPQKVYKYGLSQSKTAETRGS